MSIKITRKTKSVSLQSAELAMAVPQVIAHRMMRMALAGPMPSVRDCKEFQMMVNEKHTAFARAGWEMAMASFHSNHAVAASMFNLFFNPFSKKSSAAVGANIRNATIGVFNKGLAPVHRTAVSNAKRLAKTKLR